MNQNIHIKKRILPSTFFYNSLFFGLVTSKNGVLININLEFLCFLYLSGYRDILQHNFLGIKK